MRIATPQARNLDGRVCDAYDEDRAAIALPTRFEEQGNVEDNRPAAFQVCPHHLFIHFLPNRWMHDAIQPFSVTLLLFSTSKYPPAQGMAIQRPALRGSIGKKQVWCGWREVLDDGIVACRTGFDDLPCYEIGIDDRKGIRRSGKQRRHGGFAGRNGSCEAEEEHRKE